MKKRVFIVSILISIMLLNIGFISAYHPVCDPNNEGIHGVYINGVCYNCGDDDNICPSNYGADCSGIVDPDCTYEPEAFWSLDGINKYQEVLNLDPTIGKEVFLVVKNINIDAGTELTLNIKESDTLNDDDLGSITCVVDENNNCNATWTIDSTNLENAYGGMDEESTIDELGVLYFTINGITSNDLKINITYEEEAPEITSCSDYLDEENCTLDPESVGNKNLPPDEEYSEGCFLTHEGSCAWINGMCSQSITQKEHPLNPETCEEVEEITCNYPASMEIKSSCEGGEQFFTIKYISPDPNCEPWETQPIPCPAKLRLPFLTFYGILASISIIILGYVFLNIKKSNRIVKIYKE